MTRVHVTATDIEKGNKSSTSSCPVALAISRALHYDYAGIRVDCTGADHGDTCDGEIVIYGLRNETFFVQGGSKIVEVSAFVHAFDRGEPVSPFSFTIET